MPEITSTVSCSIADSFRVRQVAGLFDLAITKNSSRQFRAEIPADNEPWKIGLIVGPSGSGKSSIARRAFAGSLQPPAWPLVWPADRAIVDCLDGDIHQITRMLTAVGFASPPAWLRPYGTLSGGEQFRADLARMLLAARDPNLPVVMDEFTSLVDRTAARVGAAAVAGAIRAGTIQRRFVAVSCHDDVLNWLCPDWCLDMATGQLTRYHTAGTPPSACEPVAKTDAPDLRGVYQPRRTRGLLCRPQIRMAVHRCNAGVWNMFKRHHYLSQSLPAALRCYAGLLTADSGLGDTDASPVPVAFAAVAPVAGFTGYWRFSRVVVLPDFQGIGIGSAFRDTVAGMEAPACRRLSLVTSHPGMIRSLHANRCWRTTAISICRPAHAGRRRARPYGSRRICSFVWVG